MHTEDRERIQALHRRWTDLHEEQVELVHELVQFTGGGNDALWGRYQAVADEKAAVMEELRRLRDAQGPDDA